MLKGLRSDEGAWADYLITRAGLLIFCSLLLLSAFRIHPLFFQQDKTGMLDAELSHLASYMEDVDSTNVQGAHYYEFDTPDGVIIGLSSRYVTASTYTKKGRITRAQALMTVVYPSNSLWDNRSGLLSAIAGLCQDRTGIGDSILQPGDWERINEMLQQIEAELALEPFVPDTMQPLIVEKVILNYQTPNGVERRGITIVYQ